MADLQRTSEIVAECMDEIVGCFKPGVKITVLVRTPDYPDRDFCMTSDTMGEVIAMAERREAQGKTA
jgi:hypothetical protein